MAAFQNGSVVLPIFCLLLSWVWLLCGHTSEPAKPPRIDPGVLSLSSTCVSQRGAGAGRRRRLLNLGLCRFFWNSSTMRWRLAAPWGAPCWLLAALLWFYPSAVWHFWAPAEPAWVSLGLHQPSPAEKAAEFVHPDGESEGTGSSTRAQGVAELGWESAQWEDTVDLQPSFYFLCLSLLFQLLALPVESFLIYTCIKNGILQPRSVFPINFSRGWNRDFSVLG